MTSNKMFVPLINAGIILALVFLLAVIITLAVVNWNADIKKAIIWSGLITVGCLLATLYPIWMSLKSESGQQHISTFVLYSKNDTVLVKPAVTDIVSKRFKIINPPGEIGNPTPFQGIQTRIN